MNDDNREIVRVRHGLRWFAAEFLVVVSGILVALVLQALYQQQQDAQAAQVYVAQLAADLKTNEQVLRAALREDSIHLDANASLGDAYYRAGPLSADTARKWLILSPGYYSDPRPSLGTVNSLIETGDIRLMRDPAVRSAIVAYSSTMQSDFEELSRNVTRLINVNDTERLRWEIVGAPLYPGKTPPGGGHSEADVDAFLPAYLAGFPKLRADPTLRAVQQVRKIAFSNRVFYLDRMINSTTELSALLHTRRNSEQEDASR